MSYGNRSLRYNVPVTWNNFINDVDMEKVNNLNQLKNKFKKNTLDSYDEAWSTREMERTVWSCNYIKGAYTS